MKKTLQTGFLSAVIALAAGTSNLRAQAKVTNAEKATIENFQPKQELINDTNV